MNITKHIVTSANWDAGRGGHAVTGIVLHTMVGTTAGAQSRFSNPASQVSVHYGVSLDGSITQWVEEANTAYQAGNYPVNQATIGIEHEDNGNYNDAIRTDAEYQSSSDLVADICRRYNIPCDTSHIFRHHDVIDTKAYPGGTACPDGLDTNKIISLAKAKLGGTMDGVTLQVARIVAFFILGRNGVTNPINALNGDCDDDLKKGIGQPLNTAYITALYNSAECKAFLNKLGSLNSSVNKTEVLDYINKHLS